MSEALRRLRTPIATDDGGASRRRVRSRSIASRRGHAALAAIGSLVVIALLTSMLWLLPRADDPANGGSRVPDESFADTPREFPGGGESDGPLQFFCAMGMRPAVEPIVAEYEREFGVDVVVQYGGSGTLLSRLELERTGDVYLAADPSYVEIAREKGLVHESLPLLRMRPVIAVPAGNPKSITGLDDLLRPDVSFALGNPEAASIGKQTKLILRAAGEWDRIAAACRVFKPTVNEILADVMLGTVDAAVVWDPLVTQHDDELHAVHVPIFDDAVKQVTVGVLDSTTSPSAALRLARYLQAPEKGGREFERRDYETIAGDEWAVRPRLAVLSDIANRPAIERTLDEFRRREGVDIDVKYDDGPVLAGVIDSPEHPSPDVLLVGDAGFTDSVRDAFPAMTPLAGRSVAIGRHTRFPYLAQRLVDALRSDASQARFLDAGLQRGDDQP